jgi:phosphodiesterase/alkaline phosphatase D-like protein
MTRLTRRSALGLGVAGVGAAACATSGGEIAAYDGKAIFAHGVASGDPRQNAVIIWTRVKPDVEGPVPVKWTMAKDAAFKEVVKRGTFITGPERDYTVKVDVAGLEPGQVYYYWFSAGQASSPGGATRTLPGSGLADYKMAVVSCSNWPFGYFNAYREIAKRAASETIDAVIHLGDYIYEYGVTGYGGVVGKELGRNHEPSNECVSLADYRTRYAQYRSDPDLQAAHASAPWFCTWDDHESANNSYRTGAENHQADVEGDWSARKAQAVQAYLEWMPMRDPAAGQPRDAVWRKFDIGDLATLFLLESRLVGRGEDITFDEMLMAPDAERPALAAGLKTRISAPDRTMLGFEQETWLAEGLRQSTHANKKWQVLGNQVTMAKVKMPDLQRGLSAEKYERVPQSSKRFWATARYGLEWNMDAWAGFPAARERLYASAKAANARLITLTGDTHTAWANQLHDNAGQQRGVEFGCTSVTSNGAGDSLPFEELNWMMPEANDEVLYYNAFAKGFTLLTLKADQVEAEFIKVSTIRSRDYFASTDARFIARANEAGGMGALQKVMASNPIKSG